MCILFSYFSLGFHVSFRLQKNAKHTVRFINARGLDDDALEVVVVLSAVGAARKAAVRRAAQQPRYRLGDLARAARLPEEGAAPPHGGGAFWQSAYPTYKSYMCLSCSLQYD